MPEHIIKQFQKKYGKKAGKSIFYATASKQHRNPHTFKKEEFERRIDQILETLNAPK